MTDALAILLILVGLELVLGVDNILVIAIFVGRLPAGHRQRARLLGLSFALVARVLMLLLLLRVTRLTGDLWAGFSGRDLILLAGGLFLIWKAVREIHHTVELTDEEHGPSQQEGGRGGLLAVISQIVMLDLVFSIDSVLTAIGLTSETWVIILAVILSFLLILVFSRAIGEFIISHPTVKILALAFLITIGITIFMEGLHKHVPKAYIYLPMGFALLVELLQLRYEHNRRLLLAESEDDRRRTFTGQ